MSAAAAALAALEIAIASGGAAFPGRKNVGIHAETHGTTRLTPFKSGGHENAIEAFTLGLRFDLLRARNNHSADV
jgi:hypothetical protein